MTAVLVYSQRRLHLDAPGVVEASLPDDEGSYRYRYAGLRLLEFVRDRRGGVPREQVVSPFPREDAS